MAMGRGGKIAVVAVGCLVVLAALAWLNRPRDEPRKTSVADAVRSFRAKDRPRGRADDPGEPALGVYRYATRGGESVRGPGFGTTHDYGGISTIVLSAGRCGVRERWQVLAGRWSEAETCTTARGKSVTAVTEFHEFFGEGQEDSFRCHSASAPDPSELRPGPRFSSSCRSSQSSISIMARIAGTEAISVGGETFDALHTESRSALGGETSGSARREEWRRRSDGLLLRRSVESDAETNAGGGTDYDERYTIRLLSVTPER
jgi:hypothetical protein